MSCSIASRVIARTIRSTHITNSRFIQQRSCGTIRILTSTTRAFAATTTTSAQQQQSTPKITAPSQQEVAKLKSELLQTGNEFKDYNYRSFSQRHTEEQFDQHAQSTSDPAALRAFYDESQRQLAVLKRQVVINNMYNTGDYVIEKQLKLAPTKTKAQEFADLQNQPLDQTHNVNSANLTPQTPASVLPGKSATECAC